jgi:hypothetical protein
MAKTQTDIRNEYEGYANNSRSMGQPPVSFEQWKSSKYPDDTQIVNVGETNPDTGKTYDPIDVAYDHWKTHTPGNRGEWEQAYYATYAKGIRDAGGKPVDFSEYQQNLGENLDDTAKKFYRTELDKVKTDREMDDFIGKGKDELQTLINEITGKKEAYLQRFKGERADRRTELARILNEQAGRTFSKDNPTIMEELSQRGLLHSSATGEALADRRADLEREVQSRMEMYGIGDLDIEQQLAQDIINTQFGLQTKGLERINSLREAGLERKFSLDDLKDQYIGASNIAEMQARAQEEANRNATLRDALKTLVTVGTTLVNPLAGLGMATTQAATPEKLSLDYNPYKTKLFEYDEPILPPRRRT